MINRVSWVFCFCLFLTPSVQATETLIIAGAGPSTKVVDFFFQNFAKQPAAQNYSFVVPEKSIKQAGGVRHSFKNLFGRTGRPLNEEEIGYGRKEIFLGMMPISIVTGHGVNIPRLSLHQLEGIFRKRITNWKKVGGPDAEITTVGREPTEALFSELKRYYTFFRNVEFDIVLNKDQEVVEFLNLPAGWHAIAFGAATNLSPFHEIQVAEELNVGVRVGLVYDKKNDNHPLVLAVKDYAQSDEWKSIVKNCGAFPVGFLTSHDV